MHFLKNICKKNLTRNNILLKQLNLISKKRICLRFSNYWNSKSRQTKSHPPQQLKMFNKYRLWRRYRASQVRKKTCHFCMKMLDKAQISSTNNRMHNRIIFRVNNNSININLKIKDNSYRHRRNRNNSRVFTALLLCHYRRTKRWTSSSSYSTNPNSYLSNNKVRPIRPSTPKTTLKCPKWIINSNSSSLGTLLMDKMVTFSRTKTFNSKWFFKITASSTNSRTPPKKTINITTCISELLT